MTNGPIQDNLHWLLLRISLQAKHGLIKIAEGYDLSVMQVFTLFLLEPGKRVPMHSISGLLSCDPSNVTAIVDRLVAASYIEREESSTDRRVKAIVLTKAGIAARKEILEKMERGNIPNLDILSDSETGTLKELLTKIVG